MPLIEVPDNNVYRSTIPVPEQPPPAAPTLAETWDASFHLENDVVNAYEYLNRPAFKYNPAFDSGAELKKRGWFESKDLRDYFVQSGSIEEFDFLAAKKVQEQARRDVQVRSGFVGFLTSMAAGGLSPTMLMPLVGEARGVKAFFTSASLAAMAGTAQEAVLQLNQDERSISESVTSISMQTILGSVLGGLHKNLTPRQKAVIARDMANPESGASIPDPLPIHTDPTPDHPPTYPVTKRSAEGLTWFEGKPTEAGVPDGRIAVEDGPKQVLIVTSSAKGESGAAIYRELFEDAFDQGKIVVSRSEVSDDMLQTMKQLWKDGYDIRIDPEAKRVTGLSSEAESARSFREYFSTPELEESARSFGEFFGKPVEPRIEPAVNRIATPDPRRPVFTVHEGINRAVKEEVEKQLPEAVAEVVGKGQPAGAQVTGGRVGGIAVKPGYLSILNKGTNLLAKGSRVQGAMLQDEIPAGQELIWRATNGGLEHEGAAFGVPTLEGGNVESRVRYWDYVDVKGTEGMADAFQRYRFGKPLHGPAKNLRMSVAGMFGDKLSYSQFRAEVTRATASGKHVIPEVLEAAKHVQTTVHDPMFKEALKYKIIDKAAVPPNGDVNYITYSYVPEKVKAYWNDWIERVSTHIMRNLSSDFQKSWEKFLTRQAQDEELIADAGLSAEEAIKVRDKFIEELKSDNLKPGPLEDDIAEAQAIIRDKKATPEAKKVARATVKELTKQGGKPLAATQAHRKMLKRRVQGLNRHAAVLGELQAAKLDKITTLEDRNLEGLERVARKSAKVMGELDDYSPKVYAAKLRDLRNEFVRLGTQYDRMEEQIIKDAGGTAEDVLAAQKARTGKMTDTVEALARAEDINPDLARLLIKEANTDILDKVSRINNRRAMQMQRLADAAKALDPKQAEIWQKLLKERSKGRAREFEAQVEARGAEPGGGILAGKPSFKSYATDLARDIGNAIGKEPGRLSFSTLTQGQRGPEMERHLNLPFDSAEKFIETDMAKLISIYTRTLGPDIELARAYGTPILREMPLYIKMGDQINARRAAIGQAVDKNGKPLSEEAKAKRLIRFNKLANRVRHAAEATISRIRHTHGLPADPQSAAYRLGKIALRVNILRNLGGLTLNSIPDPHRIVMKHSLTTTFGVAFDALTSGFKTLKMAADIARRTGAGLDLERHTRVYAYGELLSEIGRGSKGERALEYATDKMGLLSIADFWNFSLKSIAAAADNINMMHHIDNFLHGTDIAESTTYLAKANLTGDLPERIWAQVEKGGAHNENGHWYPNVEDWDDDIASRGYLAAIGDNINHTIIVPGLERPIYTSATMPGKLISQFRSFQMASTPKMLMAAAQQRDLPVINGMILGLALGALSDYLWATAAGGDTLKRYMSADRWELADRAISKSGLQASFSMLTDVAQRIQLGNDVNLAQVMGLKFTNTRSGRTTGDSLVSTVLGPSADLLDKVAAVAVSLSHPTKSTVHKLRQVAPFQNIFYIRRLLDRIEQFAAQDLQGKSYNQ